MKIKLLAAAAFAVTAFAATSSFAATTCSGTPVVCTNGTESVTITSTQTDWTAALTAPGFSMIDDFDGVNPAAGYSVSGGQTFTGSSGVAAAPRNGSVVDTSKYEGVQVGNPFTITDTNGSLTDISFYMSSPDDFANGSLENLLSLSVNGGPALLLSGSQLWGGSPAGNGDQSLGFLVTYHFAPNTVHSLTFSQEGGPAFEFDNLAGISVPEPASWALMLLGFGGAGAALRSNRRRAMAATA
jgi:hypothetical protein